MGVGHTLYGNSCNMPILTCYFMPSLSKDMHNRFRIASVIKEIRDRKNMHLSIGWDRGRGLREWPRHKTTSLVVDEGCWGYYTYYTLTYYTLTYYTLTYITHSHITHSHNSEIGVRPQKPLVFCGLNHTFDLSIDSITHLYYPIIHRWSTFMWDV